MRVFNFRSSNLLFWRLFLLIQPLFVFSRPTASMTTSTTNTSAAEESSSYFKGGFTCPGLPVFRRTITGHHEDGLGHFLISDHGDHQVVRKAANFNYEAAQTVLYGSFEVPLNINGVDDISAIRQGYTAGHHLTNGTFVTMLDFSPGAETPFHRGESIDYNIVIEGEFDLVLDSGEVTRMKRGDVNVQRATLHKWINVSGSGKEPGRLLNVLVDIKPLFVNGMEIQGSSEGYAGRYGTGVERHPVKSSSVTS